MKYFVAWLLGCSVVLAQMSPDFLARLETPVVSAGGGVNNFTNELVSYWPGTEVDTPSVATTRSDLYGTNHLTDSLLTYSTNGIISRAVYFPVVGTTFLSVGTNPKLEMTTNSFWFHAWGYLDTLPSAGVGGRTMMAKYLVSGGHREYILLLQNVSGTNYFAFVVGTNGTSQAVVEARTFGNCSAATWYMLDCGYDSASKTLWISVNATAPDTSPCTNPPKADSNPFTIGQLDGNNPSYCWNGRWCEAALLRRSPTTGSPVSSEITQLYGSGTPSAYPYQ